MQATLIYSLAIGNKPLADHTSLHMQCLDSIADIASAMAFIRSIMCTDQSRTIQLLYNRKPPATTTIHACTHARRVGHVLMHSCPPGGPCTHALMPAGWAMHSCTHARRVGLTTTAATASTTSNTCTTHTPAIVGAHATTTARAHVPATIAIVWPIIAIKGCEIIIIIIIIRLQEL